MTLTQSNVPDQSSSSTVSITVLSVTPARAKKLFAFASVEIDIDGVQIGVHGIRAMRELGGTAIELPMTGVRRTATTDETQGFMKVLVGGAPWTRRRFPVGASPTRRPAPAGSNRSRHGGDEISEAFG